MKKIIFYALAAMAVLSGFAFSPKTLKRKLFSNKASSWISYEGKHPLHSWKAVCREVDCVVTYDEDEAKLETVAISAKVMAFDSRNTNRDSHALEALEALTYPKINFTSAQLSRSESNLIINGSLNFHGITKPLTINAKTYTEGNVIRVEGAFPVTLSEFKVDRPSLLFVKIEDEIKINFSFTFRTQ